MIPALIDDLLGGSPPDPEALRDAFDHMLLGRVPEPQIAGLLVALRARPVDGSTLAACVQAMRIHALAVRPVVRPLVDTCGTGGDGQASFNVSTAAALVVAAAGAAVAKHGNRAASSRVGSADVLEAVGCPLELDPPSAARLLDATGFVFLYAPVFHPAMAHVGGVRRALGVRTIFNLLGPLANPARAEHQLVGVYDAGLTGVMADALRELGSDSALVVYCDGLDEIGLHAATRGHRLYDGHIEPFAFDPATLGLARTPVAAIQGGDVDCNAAILRGVIAGEPSPALDVTALNAGAALCVGGLVPDLAAGYELARDHLRAGDAARVLERYVASASRLSEECAS